ncbi:MAG: sigma-54-dependent Fis family transcriptional regulator [Bdellovibrionaceae bacterium]|nr:sigma-54-dependent Fis family transcriptional regulator [Bdellovibrio sp.]
MEKTSQGFVVVIEDDPQMRSLLVDHLELSKYHVKPFSDGLAAMQFLMGSSLESLQVELILTDIRMPEMDGLSVLRQLKPLRPLLPIIMMTAHASVETAVEGLRKGAFDYFTKPFKLSEISHVIEKAISYGRLQRQNKTLVSEVKKTWNQNEIIGKSSAMQLIFDLIERVAPAHSNILITGESGSGKEVVAKAIHNRSPRAKKPFVAINCTAIPNTLLESELFGHAKGSFTGATERKKGLFEEAEGGTLFLDEIGDLDFALQAKLLRVIQERKIKAVGDTQMKNIDVRIITATHKNLKMAIVEKNFREDLYYRLAVIPIVVPPLRHRPEDIPLLCHHFLNKYTVLNNKLVTGFSFETMQRLIAMPWPGNVRELENLIERLVVLTPNSVIQVDEIPASEDKNHESFYGQATEDSPTLEELEKRYIQLILSKTADKKEKAAQILGINRRTLYRKEKEYGFVTGEEPKDETDALAIE